MKLVARADHPLQAAIWADTLRAAGRILNTTDIMEAWYLLF